MVQNPFNMIYAALFELALAHPYFKALPPGNLIRFDDPTDRSPIKNPIAAADVPELMLMLDNTAVNIRDTSDTTKCVRTFSWQLSSGDYRYPEIMSEMEWALLCAMCGWPKKLCVLKWENKTFVKRVALTNAITGISNQELNRNIQGWAAIWSAEVEMHFLTDDLLKFRCPHDGT